MNKLSKLTSPLLILNLLLPPSVFANGNKEPLPNLAKAQKAAATALNDLQRAGTEFYMDSAKKRPLNLMDLRLNSKGSAKLYAVTPYDRELNGSVGVAETIQVNQDGSLKLTVEILKNESKGLSAFPVRALKSITLTSQDTANAKVKLSRAIQSALGIAKNQMSLGMKSKSSIEKLFAKISESLMPSANASTLKIIGGVIMGIFSIALIVGGIAAVSTGGGGAFNMGDLVVLVGYVLIISGAGFAYISYDLIND